MTQLRRLVYRRGYQLGRDPGERLFEELEQAVKAESSNVFVLFEDGMRDGWQDRPPDVLEAAERKRREAEWQERNAPLPSIVRRP